MPIKIKGLIHTSIRVRPGDADVDAAQSFYANVMGLQVDEGRGVIAGIPGFWVNVREGDVGQQIHVMGCDGQSSRARSPREDPTRPHMAFAVDDINAAVEELKAQGIDYWVYEALVGNASRQVFFEDPFGNMIELQEE